MACKRSWVRIPSHPILFFYAHIVVGSMTDPESVGLGSNPSGHISMLLCSHKSFFFSRPILASRTKSAIIETRFQVRHLYFLGSKECRKIEIIFLLEKSRLKDEAYKGKKDQRNVGE